MLLSLPAPVSAPFSHFLRLWRVTGGSGRAGKGKQKCSFWDIWAVSQALDTAGAST